MTDDLDADAIVRAALGATDPADRVTIICTDNGRHREFIVGTFVGREGRWKLDSPRYERSSPDDTIRHRQKRAADAVVLHDEGAPRARYKLTCGLCGLDIVYRAERLYPMLDAAATRRVDRITI